MRSLSRAVTFFRPKGGGIIFFAYTPDMQYFKGRLPPTFSVPLKFLVINNSIILQTYLFEPCNLGFRMTTGSAVNTSSFSKNCKDLLWRYCDCWCSQNIQCRILVTTSLTYINVVDQIHVNAPRRASER